MYSSIMSTAEFQGDEHKKSIYTINWDNEEEKTEKQLSIIVKKRSSLGSDTEAQKDADNETYEK